MKKITIRTPEDIVAVAENTLGYQPEDSLVLLCIMDPDVPDGRSFGALRIDYSTSAALRLADGGAHDILDLIAGLGRPKTVLPAVFSSELEDILGLDGGHLEPQSWRAHRDGVYALCDCLVEAGFDVGQPVWSTGELCGDFTAPRGFRQMADGDRPCSMSSSAALPQPRQEIADAKRRLGEPKDFLGAFVSSLKAVESRFESGRAPADCTGCMDAAALAAADAMLVQPHRRDLLMLIVAFQNPGLKPSQLPSAYSRSDVDDLMRAHVQTGYMRSCVGYSAQAPDLDRMELGCEVLKTVAAYSSLAALPQALAVLAWMEWARGRLSFADFYSTAALDLDPENSLARLQAAAVGQGMLPAWLQ